MLDYRRSIFIGIIFLMNFSVSCSLGQGERPLTQVARGDGNTTVCPEPPKEILISEVDNEAKLLLPKIQELIQAGIKTKISRERVRQELRPEVTNWEVINYHMCIQRANGNLDRDDYRRFLTQVLPTLKEVSPPSIAELRANPSGVPININKSTSGKNSPIIETIEGDFNFGGSGPTYEKK